MRIPSSTYRLQLNADFPFARVTELIDYFSALGIGDLYFSPIFEARARSPHGYDVTNPGRVNPEIGSADELEELSRRLHAAKIGIIIDIVPNHMAASEENPWWRDILMHGPASLAAHFFDIDWTARGDARIVLPLLGRPFEEALTDGELSLAFRDGGFRVTHFARSFPIDPGTYRPLLAGLDTDPELLRIIERIGPRRAASLTEKDARRSLTLDLERRLFEWAADEQNAHRIAARLERMTNDDLRELLAAQAYALEFWRTGIRRINYRRFFDVADLAAVRVEDPDVFATTHSLILDLIRNGRINGVRVDHVDGLRDPAQYFNQLRPAVGDAFVVVEKILAAKEELVESWPVEGTTGYDFVGLVAGMYCEPVGLARIMEAYEQRTGRPPFMEIVHDSKKFVIDALFPAELDTLIRSFLDIAQAADVAVDRDSAAVCITEVTAALHVYRTYIGDEVSCYDRCVVKHAVNAARHRTPNLPDVLYTLLRNVLLDEDLPHGSGNVRSRFIADWQQFTGPVMAKGSEDTAIYSYHALTALSEVGVHPGATTASADEFHDLMSRRALRWPATLNASSTHDTKRSEDVRARIQVLTEIPDAWEAALDRWSVLAARHQRTLHGNACPDPNEQILIYQTLLGVWPLDDGDAATLDERVAQFLRKALREAKEHSSWFDPDERYESAVISFTHSLLRDEEFLADFRALQEDVAWYGALNSLSQLTLRLGAPGIPDVYQGNEAWTFRLVDPDNRHPVDFDGLRRQLSAVPDHVDRSMAAELLREWRDARIKLYITRAGLRLRQDKRTLFAQGDYIPVAVRGRNVQNVIAFARRYEGDWALIAAGRYYSQLGPRPLGSAWGDTTLALPADAPNAWHNVFTGEVTNGSALEAIFATLPFALLTA